MATTSSKSMMAKLRDFFTVNNMDNTEMRDCKAIKDIASFENVQKKECAFDSKERGVQTIKLNQITGSVGRYQDFDDQFRFKNTVPSERFTSILEAMRCGTALP
ncbi:MAG: hypothetical protein HQK65_18110, partial [Desulfamplus sp.]|nr:hypothetical protein [Desulfamplus sp.]